MNQLKTGPNIQQMSSTLASVANNTDSLNVLIVGAGRGGLAILNVLRDYDWIHIHAIIDLHHNAIAFSLAKELGIHTSIDPHTILNDFMGDIVIDVTGDHAMTTKLTAMLERQDTELIAGKSAKLLFDLVNKQLSNCKTIDTQNARLDLLDSMLAITTQLENRPPLADIMYASLLSLQTHLKAKEGLVVILNSDGSNEITHAIGSAKPSCHLNICNLVKTICQSISKEQQFKVLSQAIADNNVSYNVILPLWHQDNIVAVLLMNIPEALEREQQTTLKMSSIHLNTAAKTLQQLTHLEKMAVNDSLTGMFNRRYFDQQLHKEVSHIQREKLGTLSCVFVDIDDFKEVNDTYGHQTGDTVLKKIASCISHSVREYDTCARYGGDEFVILLPADSLAGQRHIEEIGLRMLKCISEIRIAGAPALRLSVSIGMATQSSETLHEESLLKLADLAVYQAKEAGKGCLRIHSDEQFHYPEQSSDR